MRPESSHDAAPGLEPLPRFFGVLIVLLCLGGTGWLLGRLAGFEYGLDQGIYAAVSRVMQAGGVPYLDAWDFKPPGIFFVYALARTLLGDAMSAVRLLEVMGLVSLVAAFALYARRFAGSVWPGLLGGALAVSGHVWLGFWHTGQPESFGVVLLAWALLWGSAESSSKRRQSLAFAASGAAYALAALLKPPLGGGLLVSCGIAVWRAASAAPPGGAGRARLRVMLAFGAGAALPLVAVFLYFAANGALADLSEALFVFAPEYTALNYRTGDPLLFGPRAVQILLLRFSWLNPLGVLLLFALPKMAPREREGAFHALGVMLFCLLGVALQGRFFAYHYGATVPLVALLAGFGLWKLLRIGQRFALGAVALALLLFLFANSNGLSGAVAGGFLERVRTLDAGYAYNTGNRRVAAWLRGHTREDEAIYVWGFQPMLYDLARRRPASRFVYNAPQRAPWFSKTARDVLMRDLAEDPPAAILVESGDLHPGTAATGMDSAQTLTRFPRLARLIDRDYDEGVDVGSFKIHLRRGSEKRRDAARRSRPVQAPPLDRE